MKEWRTDTQSCLWKQQNNHKKHVFYLCNFVGTNFRRLSVFYERCENIRQIVKSLLGWRNGMCYGDDASEVFRCEHQNQ